MHILAPGVAKMHAQLWLMAPMLLMKAVTLQYCHPQARQYRTAAAEKDAHCFANREPLKSLIVERHSYSSHEPSNCQDGISLLIAI